MDKQAFNTIVEGIAGKIERAIADNDGKVPYGCVSKEVATAKELFPDLNIDRNHINNMLRRRRKQLKLSTLQAAKSNNPCPAPCPTKPGRPKGTTEKQKRVNQMNIIAAKNEIC